MVEVVSTGEFDKWLRKLKDRHGKLRILERIDRLANGNPGDVKPVGRGVSELRLAYGPGYRVYYLQDSELLILLLLGGDKSTQQRDIATAQQLAEQWRSEQEDDDDQE
ncbi:MAG: type II toxin-antitoxin system RelE/ParE family toxin [Nocardia sp.]|nr:type II toxin-antitoxin system RelE/ParE family toxin [Nocardia sp.]